MRHSIKAVTFVHGGGIYLKANETDTKLMLNSMRHIAKHYSIDSISEIVEYIHIKISTYYLAQKYKPELIQAMKLVYEDELARALAEDGSASSTYITPKAYYPST